MTTACPWACSHAPVVSLSKIHSDEWLGPLLRRRSVRRGDVVASLEKDFDKTSKQSFDSRLFLGLTRGLT